MKCVILDNIFNNYNSILIKFQLFDTFPYYYYKPKRINLLFFFTFFVLFVLKCNKIFTSHELQIEKPSFL